MLHSLIAGPLAFITVCLSSAAEAQASLVQLSTNFLDFI